MKILQRTGTKSRIVSVFMAITMICAAMSGIILPASAADYGLVNPITGTVQGAGYDESAGHYGIDLYPYNYGDPVYAVSFRPVLLCILVRETILGNISRVTIAVP